MSTNFADDNMFINNVAQTPDILAVFIPTLDIIEYLTQISSTFGVWTGLSFFSLCDLFVFLKGKMRCRKESVHEAVSKEERKVDPVQIRRKASGRNALPRSSSLPQSSVLPRSCILPSGVLPRSSRQTRIENIPDTRFSPIIPGLNNYIWYPAERTVFEIGSRRRRRRRLSVPSIESTIRGLLSLNSKDVRTRNGMMIMNRTIGHRKHHLHYH